VAKVKQSDEEWSRVRHVWGTAQPLSVRALSRRFGLAEATVRGRMTSDARAGREWPRDARDGLKPAVLYLVDRLDYDQLSELTRYLAAL
jgi:hypothetical protein